MFTCQEPILHRLSADLLAQQQKAFKCIKCPLAGREWLRMSALLIYLPVLHLHTTSHVHFIRVHSRGQSYSTLMPGGICLVLNHFLKFSVSF